ncbi:primase-like DNA-binding domain-containing protein [Petralouisia muris]|uniref:primase-like DNA-binding domain-containing protein n=1 Tax=Petralouisia muris TaxID=3032872 RepID=UPI0023B79B0C|nr:primase-like DNA-binding domain-containing protein [Petralouisia muris]
MHAVGGLYQAKGTHATSKQLYSAYSQWCEDNLEKPLGERRFSNYLRQNEKRYGLDYTHNIAVGAGKTARGFKGIHVKMRTGENGH